MKLPTLTFLRPNGFLTLDADTCDMRIWRVLLKKSLYDSLEPILNWLCSLSGAECKYDIT